MSDYIVFHKHVINIPIHGGFDLPFSAEVEHNTDIIGVKSATLNRGFLVFEVDSYDGISEKVFITTGYHEAINMEDDGYLDVIDEFIKDALIFSVGAELKRL